MKFQLVRSGDCETQLYPGSTEQSLKTEADRNMPTKKDLCILVESRPELVMRYGQSKYKVKPYGAIAGASLHNKKKMGVLQH